MVKYEKLAKGGYKTSLLYIHSTKAKENDIISKMDDTKLSLEDILTKLGISKNASTTPDELDRILIKKLRQFHPDNNTLGRGKFQSPQAKRKFLKLNRARELLKAQTTLMKMPSRKITLTISELKDLTTNSLAAPNKLDDLGIKLDENVKTYVSIRIKRFDLPKLTLGAATVLLTIVLAFPNYIFNNIFLNKIFSEKFLTSYPAILGITTAWFYTLLSTGFIWYIAFRNEKGMKELERIIKRESFQNDIFWKFINEIGVRAKAKNIVSFSKDDMVTFIMKGEKPDESTIRRIINKHLSTKGRYLLDLDIAESMASLIIERALQKEVIKKAEEKRIIDRYEVTPDAIRFAIDATKEGV